MTDGFAALGLDERLVATLADLGLFGAITNEAKLAPKEIGAIEIADRFSLVEVPEDSADTVIAALKRTTIRGRKVLVRRERR